MWLPNRPIGTRDGCVVLTVGGVLPRDAAPLSGGVVDRGGVRRTDPGIAFARAVYNDTDKKVKNDQSCYLS